jgi:hypothetical protein
LMQILNLRTVLDIAKDFQDCRCISLPQQGRQRRANLTSRRFKPQTLTPTPHHGPEAPGRRLRRCGLGLRRRGGLVPRPPLPVPLPLPVQDPSTQPPTQRRRALLHSHLGCLRLRRRRRGSAPLPEAQPRALPPPPLRLRQLCRRIRRRQRHAAASLGPAFFPR